MIKIRGAREHNLADIDVDIPRNKLTVISGLSGSGKSSLAFDTLYAEGQRRYVESLSAYARQFLDRVGKPDVDSIEGLSPAISIDQKTTSRNPRSTVGTVTEIYDYLRLLFGRIGRASCPDCGRPIEPMSVEEIVDRLLADYGDTRARLLAGLVANRKGTHKKLLDRLRREGYLRVIVDGEEHFLEQMEDLSRTHPHTIHLIVDRVVLSEEDRGRIYGSVETTLREGEGILEVEFVDSGSRVRFSEKNACIDCGRGFPELSPQLFSFNSPQGACQECDGLGHTFAIVEDLVVRSPEKSLLEGAIPIWGSGSAGFTHQIFRSLAGHFQFNVEKAFGDLPEQTRQEILYGTKEPVKFKLENKKGTSSYEYEKKYAGIIPQLEKRLHESTSPRVRGEIEKFMRQSSCPVCSGERLNPFARAVTVSGLRMGELVQMEIGSLLPELQKIVLTDRERTIAEKVLSEICERAGFLIHVGLDYVTLARNSYTLSGGEAQRIRLATQIGSKLTGVLYVLDEPSIGLHQADQAKLIETLQALRDLGNTIVVVEHDEETIRTADHLVDMGPGAGSKGGHVIASGTPAQVAKVKASVTGRYLAGTHEIPKPVEGVSEGLLELNGCTLHNLKDVNLNIPLNQLVCVTGLSGSGKSSLIMDTLYPALAARLHASRKQAGPYRELKGYEPVQKVLEVNQDPIGRTPRSNPATYSGVFSEIRELFAQVPEARMRGYAAGRFSFNVKGGRCESCEGDGYTRIEMHFLPDIFVRCDICQGGRYSRETLEIKYRGKTIVDVLNMDVDQAFEFYQPIPKIRRKLEVLQKVGLGYVKLGQSATTLSGGEAQRLKLARELSRKMSDHTLYILDEPTTGLHFEDVYRLILVLQELVARGNTVLVIEHNLDVVAAANRIIDLGPGGGKRGGHIIASGTPEEIAVDKKSQTGSFLAEYLGRRKR